MDVSAENVYQPPEEFVEDKKVPLVDLDVMDSSELWLILWPINQSPDFDGKEVLLKLNGDGRIKSFECSSGKSYDVVSLQSQGPEPIVFLSSTAEAKVDSSQREDPSFLNHDSVRELSQHDNHVQEVEPSLRNGDKGEGVASTSTTLLGQEEPVFQAPPSVQSPEKARQLYHNSFTSGEIISAISASENVQTCCAVAAALLVILSHIGFPILSWGVIRGTIFFRPLYLLLLTNISVVLARLLSGKPGANAAGQMNRVTSSSENSLADQLGRALESWLLLKNIFGALLMDFSIYVVVLICGLSFMR